MLLPTASPREIKIHSKHPATVKPAIDRVLRQSQYLALRSLCVEVLDDSLLLTGRVASYYLKQLAQSHAASAADGHRIVNEIEVAR